MHQLFTNFTNLSLRNLIYLELFQVPVHSFDEPALHHQLIPYLQSYNERLYLMMYYTIVFILSLCLEVLPIRAYFEIVVNLFEVMIDLYRTNLSFYLDQSINLHWIKIVKSCLSIYEMLRSQTDSL